VGLFDVKPSYGCRSTSAGYGDGSDWLHGVWKGEKLTERLTYDMADPAIIRRSGFGVIEVSAARSAVTVTANRSRAGAFSNAGTWPP
jgi:hypothetical protein